MFILQEVLELAGPLERNVGIALMNRTILYSLKSQYSRAAVQIDHSLPFSQGTYTLLFEIGCSNEQAEVKTQRICFKEDMMPS